MHSTTPPAYGIQPPSMPVPAPRGVIGMRRCAHSRTTAATSATLRGLTSSSTGAGLWNDLHHAPLGSCGSEERRGGGGTPGCAGGDGTFRAGAGARTGPCQPPAAALLHPRPDARQPSTAHPPCCPKTHTHAARVRALCPPCRTWRRWTWGNRNVRLRGVRVLGLCVCCARGASGCGVR